MTARLAADPNVAPAYLFEVPIGILRGDARGIEEWCRKLGKQPPTLLHLGLARSARIGER